MRSPMKYPLVAQQVLYGLMNDNDMLHFDPQHLSSPHQARWQMICDSVVFPLGPILPMVWYREKADTISK